MTGRRIYLLVFALLGWFALIAQLVVHLQNALVPLGESLIRFFSYFTILTNLLVTVMFTILSIEQPAGLLRRFSRPGTQTAIVLYIVVVGLVYNIVLRSLWISEGLQWFLHDILHSVIPIAAFIYWWKWTESNRLKWKMIRGWMIYPVIYSLIVLARGLISGWYPYQFFYIDQYGIVEVSMNCILLVATFLLIGVILIALGKRRQQWRD